jgi:type-F conjugative transfer system pilin assembly protein TrbC
MKLTFTDTLLIIGIMIFSSILSCFANEEVRPQFSHKDLEFARELHAKYQRALSSNTDVTGVNIDKTNFYIFVSLNMGKKNLEDLSQLAAAYNGILVIRGLKNNSFIETATFIKEITEKNNNSGFIIDPTLFQKHNITHVPTFILAKGEEGLPNTSCPIIADRLSGNVTPKYVLNLYAKTGDLKEEATKLLLEGQ